ncbi:MAG: SDR family NAD(P)-dependent oxidoreductase [Halovenus sp.]
MVSLQDSVVVVTGGASGIGRAIARTFADRGASVVVVDIGEDSGCCGPLPPWRDKKRPSRSETPKYATRSRKYSQQPLFVMRTTEAVCRRRESNFEHCPVVVPDRVCRHVPKHRFPRVVGKHVSDRHVTVLFRSNR